MIPTNGRSIAIDTQNIIFQGGYVEEKAQALNWLFNIRDKAITPKKDMTQKRSCHSIAYDSKKRQVYAIGGCDSALFLNHCERYNIQTDSWTVIAPMAKKKMNCSASMFDD